MRLHLPVDMILRAAPPPMVAVGERPPLLPLPRAQAATGLHPSGFLSEEEFYREKQRLLSMERK